MGFRLAHISDLHVGKTQAHTESAARLGRSLDAADLDWVACTGDVTETGLAVEKVMFDRAFVGMRSRMTIVPGNHDRCGNNVGRAWSHGAAWIERPPESNVSLICLDSTQPMNNVKFMASGHLDDLQRKGAVSAATREREENRVPIVLVHHHLLPLPPDGPLEAFADWGDLPFLEEIQRGKGFVDALGVAGAKLVLHGHKHKASQRDRAGLSVVNAGCTTELGAFRIFEIERDGDVVDLGWYGF